MTIFRVLQNIELETPEGIIALTPGQVIELSEDNAITLLDAEVIRPRIAYKVYSELLGAYLWIVADDEDMKALRASENVAEPIYTHDEIKKLKSMDKEGLRTAHKIKGIFEKSKVERAFPINRLNLGGK